MVSGQWNGRVRETHRRMAGELEWQQLAPDRDIPQWPPIPPQLTTDNRLLTKSETHREMPSDRWVSPTLLQSAFPISAREPRFLRVAAETARTETSWNLERFYNIFSGLAAFFPRRPGDDVYARTDGPIVNFRPSGSCIRQVPGCNLLLTHLCPRPAFARGRKARLLTTDYCDRRSQGVKKQGPIGLLQSLRGMN